MPKITLRQSLNRQRRQLDDSARARLGAAAQSRLLANDVYRDAASVALYAPCRGEVDTAQLFVSARAAGKQVVYPRVVHDQLQFVPVDDVASLQVGSFGICEPPDGDGVPVSAIDLMLIPGIAFSRDGHRLGSGYGYYDRTLGTQGRPGVLVGLAYDFQLLETLPSEPHDVPLDLLVTDVRTLVFAPSLNPDNPVHNSEGGVIL